jgi:hypothetical protein
MVVVIPIMLFLDILCYIGKHSKYDAIIIYIQFHYK